MELSGRNAGKISAYKIMNLLGVSQAIAYKIKHNLETNDEVSNSY